MYKQSFYGGLFCNIRILVEWISGLSLALIGIKNLLTFVILRIGTIEITGILNCRLLILRISLILLLQCRLCERMDNYCVRFLVYVSKF